MLYDPVLNQIRASLKKERQETHEFILKCQENKPMLKPCHLPVSNGRKLHPERTGGGAPAIDRELEAYFHGYYAINPLR
jgi:hypothetical protein